MIKWTQNNMLKIFKKKIHQLDQGQTEYLQAVDEFLPTVEGFLEKILNTLKQIF